MYVIHFILGEAAGVMFPHPLTWVYRVTTESLTTNP